MKLRFPVPERVEDVTSHHRTFGGEFIATARTIGELCSIHAVVVKRIAAVKVGIITGKRVVVDHIHDDPQSLAMKGGDQLFELKDGNGRVARVAGKGKLKSVEVAGVIAPVVSGGTYGIIVYTVEIKHRQKVNMSYSKLYKVV